MDKHNPARLKKGCHPDFLDEEFSISVLQLVFIVFIVFIFFALAFICKGPTGGYL